MTPNWWMVAGGWIVAAVLAVLNWRANRRTTRMAESLQRVIESRVGAVKRAAELAEKLAADTKETPWRPTS